MSQENLNSNNNQAPCFTLYLMFVEEHDLRSRLNDEKEKL